MLFLKVIQNPDLKVKQNLNLHPNPNPTESPLNPIKDRLKSRKFHRSKIKN